MIQMGGDLFEVSRDLGADAICFTSNGVVKTNGDLVMGKGIALQFAQRWSWTPRWFGEAVWMWGNRPWAATPFNSPLNLEWPYRIISFPTKHHWRDKSDIRLIENSAKVLREMIDVNTAIKMVALPRPGCGLGQLDWSQVKPILEKYFDDRFIIVNKENK